MSTSCHIAVVGEVYVDHIFTDFAHVPSPGEEVFAEQYRREAGGGTVNTACALSRLGHQVSVFCVFGQDEESWLRARLSTFGVNSEHARSSSVPNALTVSMSREADRSFLSYAGANRELETYVGRSETMDALVTAEHVHFAMPLDLRLAAKVLPVLHSAGCTLSIDAGWRKEWLLSAEIATVLAKIDLFLPNESEARLLTNQSDPERILRKCLSLGIRNTGLKLGARGAAAVHEGRFYSVPAPEVHVVDTTGAGDAFDAGFLDAWLEDADPVEQLRRACMCGSLSTRAQGSLTALPSRAEMMQWAEGKEPASV